MLRRSVLKLLLHILQTADRDTIPSLWLKLKGAAQFSSRPAKLADVRCASTCISVFMAMRKIARLPSIASAAQAASKLNHGNRDCPEIFIQKLCTPKGARVQGENPAQHGNVLPRQRASKRSDAGNAKGACCPASEDWFFPRPLPFHTLEWGSSSHGLSLDALGAGRAGGARALALGHRGRALQAAGAISIAAPGLEALLQLPDRCCCCIPLLPRQLTADARHMSQHGTSLKQEHAVTCSPSSSPCCWCHLCRHPV